MWDYLTCNAILQHDGEYRAEVRGTVLKAPLEGIFNAFAHDGWEMVNCFPSGWNSAPADGPAFDLSAVMAVFRRKTENPPSESSGPFL